jgi:hypothetical protein
LGPILIVIISSNKVFFQELSKRMGSEWGERELLALICRVHELELERLEAHGAALAREHELRRRQSALRRHERQRQICDQIITQQRQLIEGLVTI